MSVGLSGHGKTMLACVCLIAWQHRKPVRNEKKYSVHMCFHYIKAKSVNPEFVQEDILT